MLGVQGTRVPAWLLRYLWCNTRDKPLRPAFWAGAPRLSTLLVAWRLIRPDLLTLDFISQYVVSIVSNSLCILENRQGERHNLHGKMQPAEIFSIPLIIE